MASELTDYSREPEWADAFAGVVAVLALMDPPSGGQWWSEALESVWLASLRGVPASLLKRSVPLMMNQFGPRPNSKAYREWLHTLADSSSRGDLPDYLTPKASLPGPVLSGSSMTNPAASVMGLLTDAGRETKRQGGEIPQTAKERLRWLREQSAKDGLAPVLARADRGCWGIEHVKADGSVDKLPARYSEAAARAQCEELSRKYSHLRVRVWCAEREKAGAA